MAKTTGLVLVGGSLPRSYDMFVLVCQRGKVRKSPHCGWEEAETRRFRTETPSHVNPNAPIPMVDQLQ